MKLFFELVLLVTTLTLGFSSGYMHANEMTGVLTIFGFKFSDYNPVTTWPVTFPFLALRKKPIDRSHLAVYCVGKFETTGMTLNLYVNNTIIASERGRLDNEHDTYWSFIVQEIRIWESGTYGCSITANGAVIKEIDFLVSTTPRGTLFSLEVCVIFLMTLEAVVFFLLVVLFFFNIADRIFYALFHVSMRQLCRKPPPAPLTIPVLSAGNDLEGNELDEVSISII